MMTTTLRIALILVSLGTFAMIMRKIRQSRMQIESAIFWIVLALVLEYTVYFRRWPMPAQAFLESMRQPTFCFCSQSLC